jgi:hypothetical protein
VTAGHEQQTNNRPCRQNSGAYGKRSAEARKKRLGKTGMSEVMRAFANKRHGNLTK